jgi:hypothetical protein
MTLTALGIANSRPNKELIEKAVSNKKLEYLKNIKMEQLITIDNVRIHFLTVIDVLECIFLPK